ncbi:MAG: carbamate kinase [Candidatus Marinimicrobia bacterium]|nr:carbamate kinase [Candidatus Neomarinimicrobiota bacterium]
MSNRKTVVIALGGNAISPSGSSDIYEEFSATRKSMKSIIKSFIENNYKVVITHGNGPQVGHELQRVELAKGIVPDVPLGVLVAETQGSIGYMIEQSLQNELKKANINSQVITLLTQVLIDFNDEENRVPKKYIGQFFTKEKAEQFSKENDWHIKEVQGKGWRRVVPSPKPMEIINHKIINKLLNQDAVVIACGGGGIPVYLEAHGNYEGFDAVIDKDLASAVLAKDISADELIILTAVDNVYLNFGKENQVKLEKISLKDAKKYYDNGEFPDGSMGPKILSAIMFLESGGKKAIITSIDNSKNSGTIIFRE